MENKKINNINKIHIAIIVIGSIFILLSVFHSNLWFDEAYSVSIANHTFSEIWTIGGNDVHPILYYWVLHLLSLIFGNKIIVYRIFSALCMAILGIIGYTHIRKDFGEKTGLIFSFLIYFLPVSSLYAGEIRMYSLGMLLGTLTAIYAYRIYKGKANKLTFVFFGFSSLAVAYTHYYGLMFTGIVNLLLLIYLIKDRKNRKNDLIKYIITAIVQIVAYIPWLICFITQLSAVSKGFWITLTFPGTLIEVLTTQFKGSLPNWIAVILSIIVYAYIIYICLKTKKEDRKPATWCIIIYISIIIIALIISLTMKSVILLYRYLLIITGPLVFAISFFMAKDEKNWRIVTVCSIIVAMSCISNINIIKENYNNNNEEHISYIKNQIQEGDIICYSNAINGAVVTTQISQEFDNTSYFYNKEHWGVEEAYKAFDPYMEIKDSLGEILENYTGRIWLIEGENTHNLLDEIDETYTINKIEDKQFKCTYRDYSYTVELIEKY